MINCATEVSSSGLFLGGGGGGVFNTTVRISSIVLDCDDEHEQYHCKVSL